MTTPIANLRPYLQDFDFTNLFIEGLGWDHPPTASLTVTVDGHDYSLAPVAQKRGFVVYQCSAGLEGRIPLYPIRSKVENQVTKSAFEHLIIFVDDNKTAQTWQWVKREMGKPTVRRELPYHGGAGDNLLQRLQGISFSIDEEDDLTVGLVSARVGKRFDVEKVTKRFYDRFKDELKAFSEFIDGITAQGDRDWYASLMLNRMMFVYFVQKQGFLADDTDYLRNKLAEVRGTYGNGQFQGFYREFLLRLFHEGLGKPENERDDELKKLLGDVPFLNGGLFDPHELEETHTDISISDETFEQVFNFFDAYSWHLDERPNREDKEINPDVLGYIFEKYVNQKQMGAYYTKEDITGYISRNTVIPFLFDAARKKDNVAFQPDGGVWRLLREDPDRYIYPAVGHGITWNARDAQKPERLNSSPSPSMGEGRGEGDNVGRAPLDLPLDIAAGIDDVSKRGGWNTAAPDDYALPTETWREVVARRQRYAEVRAKLESGEVTEINDLITLNLDIEQFARDVIAQSEGQDLLRAFWQVLRGNANGTQPGISVLDPTCGSGAFLFAALNILEPLYTACLEGMRGFVADLERSDEPRNTGKYGDFKRILDDVDKHPNERYYILKSIVLNNLYGVDIMEEAVEICKLRLFLKLVAQLEDKDQIEPLPDIDFNIRAGNTLVGFTTLDAVEQAMTVMPDGQSRQVFPEEQEILARIEEFAEVVSREAIQFRWQQTIYGGEITVEHKSRLGQGLRELTNELDEYLAREYRIDPNDEAANEAWRESHKPFHWFAEFYGIMSRGGFDVVIGNPPYVARRKVVNDYVPRGFRTEKCPDIYAAVVERGLDLCRINARTSMIVPLSLSFSSDFNILRAHLYQECSDLWFSTFGRIPSALFSFDTRVRNTIYLARKSASSETQCFTSRFHRWFDAERSTLFDRVSYTRFSSEAFGGLVPKLGSAHLVSAFETLLSGVDYRLRDELTPAKDGHGLHFKQTAYNWLTTCRIQPPVYGPNNTPLIQTKYGTMQFTGGEDRDLSMLLANGKLMFVWWMAIGDDFDLTRDNIASAPFGPGQLNEKQTARVLSLLPELETAMNDNVTFKMNAGKNIGNYNLARCRHVTDKIDKIWLEALGWEHLWEEIELEYARVVRTTFEDRE